MFDIKLPPEDAFYTKCHIGHKEHDRILATIQATDTPIYIYDFDRYLDKSEEYCTGQDIISESIGRWGVWELPETQLISSILDNKSDSNIFLDFGSQIGYYSLIAAAKGYEVHAFDASAENLELLNQSASFNHFENISSNLVWLDKDIKPQEIDNNIHLVKVDVEGFEQYVYELLKPMFKKQRINYAIFEISPVFNDSYPKLVRDIVNCGYFVYEIFKQPDSTPIMLPSDETLEKYVSSRYQENFLFSKDRL